MAGKKRMADAQHAEEVGAVESIEGFRVKDKLHEYWVHWAEFDVEFNTWEPVENLQGCMDQVVAFHNYVYNNPPLTVKEAPQQGRKKALPLESEREPARKRGRGNETSGAPRASESSSISDGRKKAGARGQGPAVKRIGDDVESEDEVPLGTKIPSRSVSALKGGSVGSKQRDSASVGHNSRPRRRSPTPEAEAQPEAEESPVQKSGSRGRNRRRAAETSPEVGPSTSSGRNLRKSTTEAISGSKKASARRTSAVKRPKKEEEEEEENEVGEASGIYTVESILGCSWGEGKTWYLVKWDGYGLDECTWEESKNVKSSTSAIRAFQKDYGKLTVKNPQILSPDGEKYVKWEQAGGKGKLK